MRAVLTRCSLFIQLGVVTWAARGLHTDDGQPGWPFGKTDTDAGLPSTGENDVRIQWEQIKSSGPVGRIPAASVVCDGKLFIFGGETDVKSTDPMVVNRYLNDLWVFTPSGSSGRWSQLSPESNSSLVPSRRVASSMVCTSGTLTVFGGVTKNSDDFNDVGDVWSFDVRRKRWTKVQEESGSVGGPGPLSAHVAVLTDKDLDAMLVFGGHNEKTGKTNDIWIFSLRQHSWSLQKPPFSPSPRNFHTAVSLPHTAAFKTWGGVDDPNVWKFDLVTRRWSIAGPSMDYRSGRMGTLLDGKLFSFGGLKITAGTSGTLDYTNAMLWQTDDDGTWDAAPTVPGRSQPTGRCYASVTTIEAAMFVYGGYHRPASVERLADLWRVTMVTSRKFGK